LWIDAWRRIDANETNVHYVDQQFEGAQNERAHACALQFSDEMNWHIITGEYPPQPGGVSDYTFMVAGEMAKAGERVTVWCPPAGGPSPANGVAVRRELGAISGSDLRHVGELLDAEPGPRRILVQWVPHMYSRRAINLRFCRWVRGRARHGDRVEIVVHEPFLDIAGSWKQRAAAVVQRWMMRTLLQNATRAWVTIPEWERLIRLYAPRGLRIEQLPVPSNIAVTATAEDAARVRSAISAGRPIVGQFGTYGHTAELLKAILVELKGDIKILLLGRGGERFRQDLSDERIIAPGAQSPQELSAHIAACDLMMQPYTGGISGRNGSLMACLAHGRAVVATSGRLTEPFWSRSDAIRLAPENDAAGFCEQARRLLYDAETRRAMGEAAAKLYESRFDVSVVVRQLLADS
jgi:glycosyltransferase involved in cell wall biosynthesis